MSAPRRFVLSCSEDRAVRLWDISEARIPSCLAVYSGHMFPVWDVSACPHSGRMAGYFASGSLDHTARLWSTERTTPLRVFVGLRGGRADDESGLVALPHDCPMTPLA